MITIYLKELNHFFSSLIGYLAIGIFLILTGLFLWVFPNYSILSYGYSSLESLFSIAPWVFLILVPAVTMRSFAEEKNQGTMELLFTKPIRDIEVIFAKFLAAYTLVIFSVLPTLIYFYSVYELGAPKGNIDTGGVWGSYIGLLFLGAAFVSIGIFMSALSGNQIVAFILSAATCFMVFMAFDFLSSMAVFQGNLDRFIEQLGISAHYESLSKGVVDTRDVIYFLTLIGLFFLMTKTVLERRKW